MDIRPNQVFLHEYDRYEPGETYEVENDLGNYFIGAGWAHRADDTSSYDLDVHDSNLGQEN